MQGSTTESMTFPQMWDEFLKVFIRRQGYLEVIEGLFNTIQTAIYGLLIGVLIGTVIAIVRVMPKYKVLPRVLDKICMVYVELFRGTPLVVQLLIGYWVLLPLMNVNLDNPLIVGVVIFGLNSGAYVSEIMRGGINSVDAGQMEAGRAVGLPYGTAMVKIVVPQAVKNILPTLGNEFIVLIKETSVLSFIALPDLYLTCKQLGDAKYDYTFPYLMLAMIYLIMVLLISIGVRLLEKLLKRSER